MNLCWMIVYIITFSLIVVIIPFAIFFYETDEDKPFVTINYYIISVFAYAQPSSKNLLSSQLF
jgi:hypothetical protein